MPETTRSKERIEHNNNSLWDKINIPKVSIWALALFLIQAEYVIVKYANKVDVLETAEKDNKVIHQAFIQTFIDLKVNPYDHIPGYTTVRGISETTPAKHEDILTCEFYK